MQCLHFVANWSETVAHLQVREGVHLDKLVNCKEVTLFNNYLVKSSLKFFGIDQLEGQSIVIPYNHINDLECLINSIENLISTLGYTDIFVARSIVKQGMQGSLYLQSFSLSDTNLDKLGKSPYKLDNPLPYRGKRPERRYQD